MQFRKGQALGSVLHSAVPEAEPAPEPKKHVGRPKKPVVEVQERKVGTLKPTEPPLPGVQVAYAGKVDISREDTHFAEPEPTQPDPAEEPEP